MHPVSSFRFRALPSRENAKGVSLDLVGTWKQLLPTLPTAETTREVAGSDLNAEHDLFDCNGRSPAFFLHLRTHCLSMVCSLMQKTEDPHGLRTQHPCNAWQ